MADKLDNQVENDDGVSVPQAGVSYDNNPKPEPELPVFWDGKPGTLNIGMVCRDGRYSVQVLDIKQCLNGTSILGLTIVNGEGKLYNVTQPEAHPLSRHESATPEQRDFIRKLWEYDNQ